MEKSFHKRNLPHLYFSEGQYFITYRLVNSIPKEKLLSIRLTPNEWDFEKFSILLSKYDALMESGEYGIDYLMKEELAEICKFTLHFADGTEYKLICFCIMPNHIYVIFELLPGNKSISKIMQSIKGISAIKCNSILNRQGKFWQDESFDRLIRDEKELFFIIRYILLNPVNAGLVKNWHDWKYTFCHPDYIVL